MAPSTVPTEEQMRTVVLAIRDAWNAHDPDGILAYLTDDAILTEPSVGRVQGREPIRRSLEQGFTALPDQHFPLEDYHLFISADPPFAVAVWTMTATMTGGLPGGIPPTGRSLRMKGAVVIRFRRDRVTELTLHFDGLEFLNQLGLLPEPASLAGRAGVLVGLAQTKARQLIRR